MDDWLKTQHFDQSSSIFVEVHGGQGPQVMFIAIYAWIFKFCFFIFNLPLEQPKSVFFFSSSFRFHNWYILQWASLTYNACVKFWKKFRKKHKSFLRYSVRLTVNLAWWVLSKPILKFISSTKCFITLPVGMRSKLDFAGAMNVHFILMHPGYIYWVW